MNNTWRSGLVHRIVLHHRTGILCPGRVTMVRGHSLNVLSWQYLLWAGSYLVINDMWYFTIVRELLGVCCRNPSTDTLMWMGVNPVSKLQDMDRIVLSDEGIWWKWPIELQWDSTILTAMVLRCVSFAVYVYATLQMWKSCICILPLVAHVCQWWWEVQT